LNTDAVGPVLWHNHRNRNRLWSEKKGNLINPQTGRKTVKEKDLKIRGSDIITDGISLTMLTARCSNFNTLLNCLIILLPLPIVGPRKLY
jgi:hypothetical protein